MDHILYEDIHAVLTDSKIDQREIASSNIMITGATGLIGSLLVKVLLELFDAHSSNKKVIALVRDPAKAEQMLGTHERLSIVCGDVRRPISVVGEVDYIIHCASVTASRMMTSQPVETFLTAVEGTRNILELAKEKHVKGVLNLSSMEVYGAVSDANGPTDENKLGYIDLYNARSSYPEAKRACEMICNAYSIEYGVKTTSARLAQTFGAGVSPADDRVFMQFARSVIDGTDIVLHTAGRSLINFCYTTDAVRGLLLLLTRGKSEEAYNICNDSETRSVAEIAQLAAGMNRNVTVVYDIPPENIYGYAPETNLRLSSKKIRELGWLPAVSMEGAYSRLIAYLKAKR